MNRQLPDTAKNRQLRAEIERIQAKIIATKFYTLDAYTVGRFAKSLSRILTDPSGVFLGNGTDSDPEGLAQKLILEAMRSGLQDAILEDNSAEGGRRYSAFDLTYPEGHYYREAALSNQARTYGGPLAKVFGDEAWGTEVLQVVAKGTAKHLQGAR